VVLGKTQYEIENEYAFIDLPKLLVKKNERRALEMLEDIQVATFPHLMEQRDRKAVLKRLQDQVETVVPSEVHTVKPAEEQYQERLRRIKAGGG
jgi:hypothetical protein